MTFETLYIPIPIYIANGSTFTTGKGSIILKHLSIDTKEVATMLESVFFCEDLMCQLLSLGAFLQDSFSVKRNKDLVTVNMHSSIEFMIFKPKMMDNTIYVLQILDQVKKYQSTHSVNSIDFEIVYYQFGHPSQKTLRQARKHTLEFSIINIPSFDSLCPGYIQDKMPNYCFLESNHCAIHLFQLVHSNLKMFPILSYYHQKYLITFYNNFTSYAWISLLTTKDKAILATRQFLAFIENQYHMSVQM